MKNSWEEERNLVLFRLDAMDKKQEATAQAHEKKLDQLLQDVSALKVKAGYWGFLGGAAALILAMGINALRYLK